MSFCKVGEKAYLRINGSEVWTFDGPITVGLREEQDLVGKTVGLWEVIRGRPDSLGLIIHGFDSIRATVNRTRYECRFGVCGNVNYFLISVKGRNFADSTGRNIDRFYPIGPDGLRTWAREERGTSTVYGEAYPDVVNWVVRPHNPNETVPIRYFLEVRNPTTGQLLLDRPYGMRPTYTVRCGDKCPPGQKWSEKCKACVCEGMDGVLAGLKSATAIARSIK